MRQQCFLCLAWLVVRSDHICICIVAGGIWGYTCCRTCKVDGVVLGVARLSFEEIAL